MHRSQPDGVNQHCLKRMMLVKRACCSTKRCSARQKRSTDSLTHRSSVRGRAWDTSTQPLNNHRVLVEYKS